MVGGGQKFGQISIGMAHLCLFHFVGWFHACVCDQVAGWLGAGSFWKAMLPCVAAEGGGNFWLGTSLLLQWASRLTGLPQWWVCSKLQDFLKPSLGSRKHHFCHILLIKVSHKVRSDSTCGGDRFYLLMQRATWSHCKGVWGIAAVTFTNSSLTVS